jgi:hypothetical protein
MRGAGRATVLLAPWVLLQPAPVLPAVLSAWLHRTSATVPALAVAKLALTCSQLTCRKCGKGRVQVCRVGQYQGVKM